MIKGSKGNSDMLIKATLTYCANVKGPFPYLLITCFSLFKSIFLSLVFLLFIFFLWFWIILISLFHCKTFLSILIVFLIIFVASKIQLTVKNWISFHFHLFCGNQTHRNTYLFQLETPLSSKKDQRK